MSKPPREPYPPDPDEDAEPEPGLELLVDAVAAGEDWANARAPRWSPRRAQLRDCRLTGAELAEATIADTVFDGCRLDLAALRHARLERVVFRDCRMSECDFLGARLKDVLFERCDLREATLSLGSLERVELRGCDLTGARGADSLRGARMPWDDVLQNAPLFAAVAGIEILDDR